MGPNFESFCFAVPSIPSSSTFLWNDDGKATVFVTVLEFQSDGKDEEMRE